MKKTSRVEYIWLDGAVPTQQLRSKTRILSEITDLSLDIFPEWSFDGSSTNQALGNNSDCVLKPVSYINDPFGNKSDYMVMCEVYDEKNNVHPSNLRAKLREIWESGGSKTDAYIGFEQEYTFMKDSIPLGWPKNGYPAPQGPFYCGIGATNTFGREIVEKHTQACLDAGINLYGINAEVMPGQWEFQIGHRGFTDEPSDPISMSDHVWFARYLLHRVAEEYGVSVSLDNKPVKGDWNGAGMHTNFSTKDTRNPSKGLDAIQNSIKILETHHEEHIQDYGHDLQERLTGLHETCSINEFRSGVSDRGASIRIPLGTAQKGYGYFEDRRPGANANPYAVSIHLLQSACNIR